MSHARANRSATRANAGEAAQRSSMRRALSASPPPYGIALADRGVIRRACKQCEEEAVIRRSPAAQAQTLTPELHDYLASSSGRGQPLDPQMRALFENSLDTELSGVRVVADQRAAAAADTLGARAFTFGSTIWFGRGEYRPATRDGQRLLAHEVAHTVQQCDAAPAIQRELLVGDARDPAEAAADRAADAMMRGEPAELGAGTGRVVRRECRAEPPPVPRDPHGQRLVTCTPENERWIVREIANDPSQRRSVTRARATFRVDERIVEGAVTICRGGTEVILRLNANLTEAAVRAVGNALNGASLGQGVTIEPQLAIVITQSERFRLTFEGGPSISGETGQVERAGGSITLRTPQIDRISIGVDHRVAQPGRAGAPPTAAETVFPITISLGPPPSGISHVDCSELPPRYECRRFIPEGPRQPGTIGIPRQATTRVYALFPHNSAVIRGWRFEGSDTMYAATDPQVASHIHGLILQGYAPRSVWGYTSPEGEERLPRPTPRSGFPGNVPLSQQRANAARAALFSPAICAGCPTFEGAPVIPFGFSELYGQDAQGREIPRGPGLEQHAIDRYSTEDELRPSDLDAFRRTSRSAQLTQTYDMLRRAVITFERTPWLLPPRPSQPGTPERLGAVEPRCPTTVEQAARESLHPPFMPGENR